ncbi:MAG TPA: UDP-N-acetylmuramoyl-L-alanyl-D-glutamate--2,6-diaminopimelate ligase [Terriglobales bacterium]|nr:UDP-N-acetylmuramoyl-L-alanyl-D-glutamate--2,6-diaminopimelate ligase [Terriglobales bacterium]
MKFSDLLFGAEVVSITGDADIFGLQYNSRRVQTGDCFVAMKGETTDGNAYIDSGVGRGAFAVVTDSETEPLRDGVGWAVVKHGRRALAMMSGNLYHHPAQTLKMVGVTGTNGKTTTAFLIETILNAAGRKTALVGTIEYRLAGEVVPAPHTTPESLDLNRFLADGVKRGVTDAVMEVSSHALYQERVYGVPYDVAVFTNLTRDHLDYHKTMGEYFAAKQILFKGCGTEPPRVAVLNRDDGHGLELVQISKKLSPEISTYGLREGHFHTEELKMGPEGSRFVMVTPKGNIDIFTPLLGKVNVYNVLAAAAAAMARGCTLLQVADAVRGLAHVPGRFQRVNAGQPFTVVVDYAHTDDALRNLTTLAEEFVKQSGGKGRVITVFGCGGDRDKTKRPLMGQAVGDGSDFVILTSDNPRTENPLSIIYDAVQGLRTSKAEFTTEPDRKRAIALAIRLAKPGDIILIAGKGHEKVQIIGEQSVPFDDVKVAEKAIRAQGYGEDFAAALGTSRSIL